MTGRSLLVGCGVVSSALYLAAIDVLAPLARPEYHSYARQMVSELFAAGAPTRPLLAPLMIAYNVLVAAFAIGVWMGGRGSRAQRFAAVALGVYAAFSTAGFVVAPMDVRVGGGVTEGDLVHIVATALQGVAFLSALVFGAYALGPRFRRYSFVTLATSVLFGALAGFFARGSGSPWLGTTERVSIYAWMGWIAAFAVALVRRDARVRRAS